MTDRAAGDLARRCCASSARCPCGRRRRRTCRRRSRCRPWAAADRRDRGRGVDVAAGLVAPRQLAVARREGVDEAVECCRCRRARRRPPASRRSCPTRRPSAPPRGSWTATACARRRGGSRAPARRSRRRTACRRSSARPPFTAPPSLVASSAPRRRGRAARRPSRPRCRSTAGRVQQRRGLRAAGRACATSACGRPRRRRRRRARRRMPLPRASSTAYTVPCAARGRRGGEVAELALPAHAGRLARDRVQRAVVLEQVERAPAQHRRELEQHAAGHRPLPARTAGAARRRAGS